MSGHHVVSSGVMSSTEGGGLEGRGGNEGVYSKYPSAVHLVLLSVYR